MRNKLDVALNAKLLALCVSHLVSRGQRTFHVLPEGHFALRRVVYLTTSANRPTSFFSLEADVFCLVSVRKLRTVVLRETDSLRE